jgi:hypothetical protein
MNRGDHLVTPRNGYTHHGLYVGSDLVIHYAGLSDGFNKESIELTSLDSFCNGCGYIIKSHPFRIFDGEKSVERAYSKLGEDSYNIIFNNCEHFVTWCIYGIHSSSQVNTALSVAVVTTNLLLSQYGKKLAGDVVLEESTKLLAQKASAETVRYAMTSNLTKSAASSAIGLATASTVTGTTTAGVVSAIAVGSAASVASTVLLPATVAIGVGYAAKKLFDKIWG